MTSIDWLINQIKEDQTIKAKSMSEWSTVFEQAKEMHKDEIIKAVYHHCSSMSHSDLPCGEKYYNETFKLK